MKSVLKRIVGTIPVLIGVVLLIFIMLRIIPGNAAAVLLGEHVDQATRDKLVEFLTSYDNEQYFTDVIKVPGARFVECDMSD